MVLGQCSNTEYSPILFIMCEPILVFLFVFYLFFYYFVIVYFGQMASKVYKIIFTSLYGRNSLLVNKTTNNYVNTFLVKMFKMNQT